MNNLESDQAILLNILNVFKRISNEDFILNYWGKGRGYNSIVTSCKEAIEILDDYWFFDIIHAENKGTWQDTVKYLNQETNDILLSLAFKLDEFKNFDSAVEDLLLNEQWIQIMKLSKAASLLLEKELGLTDQKDYMI